MACDFYHERGSIERYAYTLVWDEHVLEADIIENVVWLFDTDMTEYARNVSGQTTTILLEGGMLGQTYNVRCIPTFSLSGPRERSIDIRIIER